MSGPDIRFSGDDGDVGADVLGIGYPQSAIDEAEAAEELSASSSSAASPGARSSALSSSAASASSIADRG